MSPDVSPAVFIAAMTALACTLLGGLYLLFRHEPTPDEKARQQKESPGHNRGQLLRCHENEPRAGYALGVHYEWGPKLSRRRRGSRGRQDSGSCARSQFRVLIDVGHTATSPGADSARGVPEYEFNLKLADVITQSLHEAGFDKTVRLVTSGTRLTSLFQRAATANNLHGDLPFPSITI